MTTDLTIFGGFLLGLAASLHCAAMCGGIASGITFMFDPKDARARAVVLLTAQAGRIVAYCLGGALVGVLGTAVYGVIQQELAFQLLQWAAAVTLLWIGLSVAGILPPLSALDGVARHVMPNLTRVTEGLQTLGPAAPFALGLTWGLLPCAMVYAALFTAMLTGSAFGGAQLMLGFGLGTLPAVTLTAFGVTGLARIEARALARTAVGLGIACVGIAGVYADAYATIFCLP
ncbi:MAG: sulfite exporter TauE/SafE family protein [Pseudomonadota bacterium]